MKHFNVLQSRVARVNAAVLFIALLFAMTSRYSENLEALLLGTPREMGLPEELFERPARQRLEKTHLTAFAKENTEY